MKLFFCLLVLMYSSAIKSQIKWVKQDTFNVPSDVEVYYTNQKIDTNFNVAYYVKAKLKSKQIEFDTDTTLGRRLTPKQFYDKNNNPLIVVNGTFFSFETNKNLNVVIDNGKVVSHNLKVISVKDSIVKTKNIAINRGAIGIDKFGNADVAWIKTDSNKVKAFAQQTPFENNGGNTILSKKAYKFKKWKMKTAIGGGPILVQNGKEKITNDYEAMFTGKKGLTDKHPRTAMGYTADGYLIILVVQGRMPGIADGMSLKTLSKTMIEIGCKEALNLDGGGSSCMLINGKETIKPSYKGMQRPVPAVFVLKAQ